MSVVLTDAFMKAVLTDAIAHAVAGPHSGTLDGLKMILFTNVMTLQPSTLYADLTQPAYTGYAVGTVTWGAVVRDPDGSWSVFGAEVIWQMGDGVLPTTVVGYGLELPGTPNVLMAAEIFDAPRTLVTADDVVIVIPRISIGGDTFGSATVIP